MRARVGGVALFVWLAACGMRSNEQGDVAVPEPDAAATDVGASDADDGTDAAAEADAPRDMPAPAQRRPGPCADTTREAGGRAILIVAYTYDDDGRVLTDSRDHGADGTVDVVTTRTYDAMGDLVRWERDNPVGGAVEWVIVTEYDDQRRTVRQEEDRDGARIVTTWTWTGEHSATMAVDSDGDGTVDVTTAFAQEYDADGNLLHTTYDQGPDGTIDTEHTYTYEGGLLVEVRIRTGDVTIRTVNTYDEAGNLVSEQTDYENDGVFDSETRSTYDAAGNRLSYTAGGLTVEADYTCW